MLNYPTDVLVLTAIRHNLTGAYMRYDAMVVLAKQFSIPVTEALETRGLSELQAMKKLENVEGFVIRFDDGRMYKVRVEALLEFFLKISNTTLQGQDRVVFCTQQKRQS